MYETNVLFSGFGGSVCRIVAFVNDFGGLVCKIVAFLTIAVAWFVKCRIFNDFGGPVCKTDAFLTMSVAWSVILLFFVTAIIVDLPV